MDEATADRPLVLIVDDDPDIASALARGLGLHGYVTAIEDTVAGALARLGAPDVHAAIVDVMIGEDSGLALVEAARSAGMAKPILMLSALSEVDDRARGLRAGADDYVVKPFALDELVARLQVQEARASERASPRESFDRRARVVQGAGRRAELTERESRLLEILVDNAGRVLSRGAIFDALWTHGGGSSENVVDVYIGYLRKKLAPPEAFGFEIQTIRSRGFVLRPTGTE